MLQLRLQCPRVSELRRSIKHTGIPSYSSIVYAVRVRGGMYIQVAGKDGRGATGKQGRAQKTPDVRSLSVSTPRRARERRTRSLTHGLRVSTQSIAVLEPYYFSMAITLRVRIPSSHGRWGGSTKGHKGAGSPRGTTRSIAPPTTRIVQEQIQQHRG